LNEEGNTGTLPSCYTSSFCGSLFLVRYSLPASFWHGTFTIAGFTKNNFMERREQDALNDDNRMENRKDMDPGMPGRNLLSDTHSEAPIDKDPPMAATSASDEGDENYADEELNDRDYFEKRAPDNVRK
jgi:hypothetical protein